MKLIDTIIFYSNNVTISYGFDKNNNIIIFMIEALNKGKGDGTKALKEFMQKFNNYDICLGALPERVNWYLRNGFEIINNDYKDFVEMIRRAN